VRVAIVGPSFPYPPTSGNRIRTVNLLVRLARRHRITYICYRENDRRRAHQAVEYLGDHGIESVEVDHAVPSKRGIGFYARLAANLMSPLPYSVASFAKTALRRAISDYAARHEIDLWQAEGAPFFEPLRGLAGTPRVLMAHNVESLIWERHHATERNRLKRWYIKQQWQKFEQFEQKAFAESDRVVTVSPEDAAIVRDRFDVDRVDVVDNGIDRSYFESVLSDRDPARILFLGSFEWRPNLDAVSLLLDRIFPEVRAAEPSARLDLVGRNPPASLARRVDGMAGVALHADVPDIRPYLAQSGVMAVPLRIGGGSRLKILEALATGLPVVSTYVGAEGLHLEPERDFTLVEHPEKMASVLLRCIQDPGPAREMAGRGRRLVLERYDWDALAEELERAWQIACEIR